ncbi:MAG: fibrillarin-like rRNA/tRNA 2'-O-methyltransferase [Candidatus Thorarchaeota archaeon]
MKIAPHKFPGVFTISDERGYQLGTRALVAGQSVYGERTITENDTEYRLWSPRRSKLAAAIQNGLQEFPIQPGSHVLYLGAASGTTVSHVSDIVGPEGCVFAVEFSATVARALFQLAHVRQNVNPIVADARHPTQYLPLLRTPVDVVYQDVAQPDQARILALNMRAASSYGGWGMIAIKARSVSSTTPVTEIYRRETAALESLGLEVVERVMLDPFERDHIMVTVRSTG